MSGFGVNFQDAAQANHRVTGPLARWLAPKIGPRNAIAAQIFTVTTAIVLVLGFLVTLLLQPKYTAMAIIGPQPSPQEDATSGGLTGGLGGLSSFLGGAGISQNMQAFQVLIGTAGFADYMTRHDHIDRVFFPNGIHRGIVSTSLHALFRQPVSNQVTVGDVQRVLQTSILIQLRTQTPYLEIYYTNPKREDAIGVLNAVIRSADRVLRGREAKALNTQISYLAEATRNTGDVERLNTFRSLLGRKLESKVLIETQETYAFKIFDLPFAPYVPNSPNIALLVLVLTVMSLGTGVIAALGWLWWKGGAEK